MDDVIGQITFRFCVGPSSGGGGGGDTNKSHKNIVKYSLIVRKKYF